MRNNAYVLLLQLLLYAFIIFVNLAAKTCFAQSDFYTPKSLIIPLHDQKNQLHVSVGRGGGYDLHISYAFSKHFAFFNTTTIDNGTKNRSTLFGDDYKVERNDNVIKGGLGYFTNKESAKQLILEAYLGYGISKVDNYWHYTENAYGDLTQANYRTLFVQLNRGRKIKRSEYALGLRLAYSKYRKISFSNSHPNSIYIKSNYDNLQGLSADPAISYSYLLKGFKLNAQAGLAIPVGLGSTSRTDAHILNDGTTIIRSEEKVPLWAVLGRISLQYNLNLNQTK